MDGWINKWSFSASVHILVQFRYFINTFHWFKQVSPIKLIPTLKLHLQPDQVDHALHFMSLLWIVHTGHIFWNKLAKEPINRIYMSWILLMICLTISSFLCRKKGTPDISVYLLPLLILHVSLPEVTWTESNEQVKLRLHTCKLWTSMTPLTDSSCFFTLSTWMYLGVPAERKKTFNKSN